jgi:hypothetical protein
MSIFDSISNKAESVYDNLSNRASGMIDGVKNFDAERAFERGLDDLGSQLESRVMQEIDSRINTFLGQNEIFGALSKVFGQDFIMSKESEAFRGVSLAVLRERMREQIAIKYAKKNLFVVSVKNSGKNNTVIENPKFNLFVIGVDYTPITISGEKKNVGTAVIDSVSGTESIDLRLTCMDDKRGSVRAWFEALANSVTHQDGTVGVPADYMVQFTITHGAIDHGKGGFQFIGHFRPVSLEVSANRSDEALTELSLSFTQLDTFY